MPEELGGVQVRVQGQGAGGPHGSLGHPSVHELEVRPGIASGLEAVEESTVVRGPRGTLGAARGEPEGEGFGPRGRIQGEEPEVPGEAAVILLAGAVALEDDRASIGRHGSLPVIPSGVSRGEAGKGAHGGIQDPEMLPLRAQESGSGLVDGVRDHGEVRCRGVLRRRGLPGVSHRGIQLQRQNDPAVPGPGEVGDVALLEVQDRGGHAPLAREDAKPHTRIGVVVFCRRVPAPVQVGEARPVRRPPRHGIPVPCGELPRLAGSLHRGNPDGPVAPSTILRHPADHEGHLRSVGGYARVPHEGQPVVVLGKHPPALSGGDGILGQDRCRSAPHHGRETEGHDQGQNQGRGPSGSPVTGAEAGGKRTREAERAHADVRGVGYGRRIQA